MSSEMKNKVTLHVVLKPPGGEAARAEVDGSEDGHLAGLQQAVGGRIDRYMDPDLPGIDIWLNEEGRVRRLPANVATAAGCLVGTLVFARTDRRGQTVSLRDDDVRRVIAWCRARDVYRRRAPNLGSPLN